jgi:hypothetical protein
MTRTTIDIQTTQILAGREVAEGTLPAGTRIDGHSIRAARKVVDLAMVNGERDPDITLVVSDGKVESAERAPLSVWRAAGVAL